MDKVSKYLKKEHKVGAHISVQSGLAFFVAVMGVLFYIDAAPGAHTQVALLTIAMGVSWLIGHHVYAQWHERHHHEHHPH